MNSSDFARDALHKIWSRNKIFRKHYENDYYLPFRVIPLISRIKYCQFYLDTETINLCFHHQHYYFHELVDKSEITVLIVSIWGRGHKLHQE